MTPCAPAEIRIGPQALTLLDRLLDAASPEEGCALLLGLRPAADAGSAWRITALWPTGNVWQPAAERRRRFLIDPREQLQAMRWARGRGLEVLGSVHSHPHSAPVPSPIDRALAGLPTLMLIRGSGPATAADPGSDPAAATLRCWWVEPDHEPRLLPWRMEA